MGSLDKNNEKQLESIKPSLSDMTSQITDDDVFKEDDSHDVRKSPDGGWGWVILVATFFNYIVVSAIWYSFSILYKEYVNHFQASLASVGILTSVEAAALHFTGAFCGGLVEKYGSRPVAMIGSFIAAASLFAGAFAQNIELLYVTYGIAGSGIGLSYVSFVIIIQQYFDKRRALASGFSLTGFSLASFGLPPFTRWLIDQYGWRGTLIILSGFYLNGIALAALLRPLPRYYQIKPRPRVRSFSQRLSRQLSVEKTRSRMNKLCKACQKVFDYTLFKDSRFLIFGFGTMFMMIGHIAFFMHLVNKALRSGMDTKMATFLPSVYGISNGICRIVFSVIYSLPKANRVVQYGIWIIIGGIISCLSCFATDFIGMAIICAAFGMCVGSFICIQYPALVDLLGVGRIAQSAGLLQIFLGTAGLVATPLAGWIYDATDDFNIAYTVLGIIMILGGSIILIIPLKYGPSCCARFQAEPKEHIKRNPTFFSMDTEKGVLKDGTEIINSDQPKVCPPQGQARIGRIRHLSTSSCAEATV